MRGSRAVRCAAAVAQAVISGDGTSSSSSCCAWAGSASDPNARDALDCGPPAAGVLGLAGAAEGACATLASPSEVAAPMLGVAMAAGRAAGVTIPSALVAAPLRDEGAGDCAMAAAV